MGTRRLSRLGARSGSRAAPGPRAFDAVVVGNRETDAWVSYYRRDWRRFLVASVYMVGSGFGMGPWRTLLGAWHVMRANQLWAPIPDNDPDGARESMRRFYALVFKSGAPDLDPVQASRLEVEWWRVHRAHQYGRGSDDDALKAALVSLYAYVYGVDGAAMQEAAAWRVRAMDLSDRWVAAGRRREDPALLEQRRALVASYAALRDAAARAEHMA